jgi:hypothetical protein
VRHRHQRQSHADHPGDLGGEHAAAVHDGLAVDAPLVGVHPRHPAAVGVDGGHPGVRVHLDTLLAGQVRQRVAELGRVQVAVRREVGAADHAGGVDQGEHLLRLGGRDLLQGSPYAVAQPIWRGSPPSARVTTPADAAALDPPGRVLGLLEPR